MRRLLRMLSASLLALTLLVTSLSSATFALAAPGSSTAESPATKHSSAVTGVEKVADPDTSPGWRAFFGIDENNPVYSTDKPGASGSTPPSTPRTKMLRPQASPRRWMTRKTISS